MSTISFPDWINSLSPQSTDGKEVYQQDGSTPSRGDLDDKASLSGGADADFSLIPFVDGSAIIERDSNDDGEWIRLYNGFQLCFLPRQLETVSLTSEGQYTTRYRWDFPNEFLEESTASSYNFPAFANIAGGLYGNGVTTRRGTNPIIMAGDFAANYLRGQYIEFKFQLLDSGSADRLQYSAFAIGQWK